jgi:hypothetical protein
VLHLDFDGNNNGNKNGGLNVCVGMGGQKGDKRNHHIPLQKYQLLPTHHKCQTALNNVQDHF